jgi:hypothetical protein
LALEGEHPAPKKSQGITVFISYASEDFQQADRLYKDLKMQASIRGLINTTFLQDRTGRMKLKMQ